MTNYNLTSYHPKRTKNSQPQKTIFKKKKQPLLIWEHVSVAISLKKKKKKETRYHSPITVL